VRPSDHTGPFIRFNVKLWGKPEKRGTSLHQGSRGSPNALGSYPQSVCE